MSYLVKRFEVSRLGAIYYNMQVIGNADDFTTAQELIVNHDDYKNALPDTAGESIRAKGTVKTYRCQIKDPRPRNPSALTLSIWSSAFTVYDDDLKNVSDADLKRRLRELHHERTGKPILEDVMSLRISEIVNGIDRAGDLEIRDLDGNMQGYAADLEDALSIADGRAFSLWRDGKRIGEFAALSAEEATEHTVESILSLLNLLDGIADATMTPEQISAELNKPLTFILRMHYEQ